MASQLDSIEQAAYGNEQQPPDGPEPPLPNMTFLYFLRNGQSTGIETMIGVLPVSIPHVRRLGLLFFRESLSKPATAIVSPLTNTASQSIPIIETNLPPLHSVDADFGAYTDYKSVHFNDLVHFYSSGDRRWRKRRWDAEQARQIEFQRIADSLLRIVGGCIRAHRKEEDKVLIGNGLGQSSPINKLSLLHTSFRSHFVQKAWSLNYLVVGIDEYYTSKKCPTCHNFVAQSKDFRQLFCSTCKKYFHQEQMAGRNMASIFHGHLWHGERPGYLQSTDDEDIMLWSSKHRVVDRDEDVPVPQKSNIAD